MELEKDGEYGELGRGGEEEQERGGDEEQGRGGGGGGGPLDGSLVRGGRGEGGKALGVLGNLNRGTIRELLVRFLRSGWCKKLLNATSLGDGMEEVDDVEVLGRMLVDMGSSGEEEGRDGSCRRRAA